MTNEIEIIILADCSESMKNRPIKEVNNCLNEIKNSLPILTAKHKIAVSMRVISFADTAYYFSSFNSRLKASGRTNISAAFKVLYKKLVTDKPKPRILLFLTDGCPTSLDWKKFLNRLYTLNSFKQCRRFSVLYGNSSHKEMYVAKSFVGKFGKIKKVFDINHLRNTIKSLAVKEVEKILKLLGSGSMTLKIAAKGSTIEKTFTGDKYARIKIR